MQILDNRTPPMGCVDLMPLDVYHIIVLATRAERSSSGTTLEQSSSVVSNVEVVDIRVHGNRASKGQGDIQKFRTHPGEHVPLEGEQCKAYRSAVVRATLPLAGSARDPLGVLSYDGGSDRPVLERA